MGGPGSGRRKGERPAMTSAERVRAYRARHSSGAGGYGITLSGADAAFLREARERCNDAECTFGDWLRRALITGAKFRANAGRPRGDKLR